MKCEICKSEMILYPIKEIIWCDVDKGHRLTKTGEEWRCHYCEWKGSKGIGDALKKYIKEHNNAYS